MRLVHRSSAIAVGLIINLPAIAGTNTWSVAGSLGKTEQACQQLLTINVGDGENCTYNGGPVVNVPSISPAQYPAGEATGPYSFAQYYDSAATPQTFSTSYVATPGDGKINQVINGTVTVDDRGTANPADDLLSFNLTMRSPGSGDVIRNLGSGANAAEESYTTMTQVLAPHAVNFATQNSRGGIDYIIGSAGFPTRLVFSDPYAVDPSSTNPAGIPGASPCNGQLFGDMECAATFHSPYVTDPLRWSPWSTPGSGRPGMGAMEGNIGARTVGTVTGYQCIDTGANNACKVSKVVFAPLLIGPNGAPGGGVTAEDVGWDQVLLKVSTDGQGNVIALAGYDVQEFQTFGSPVACGSDPGATFSCNSWVAGYFSASVVPLPAGAFLFPSALAALG